MQNPNIPISQHQCCSFLSFQPQWFHDSTSPETNDAVRRQASPNQAPTSGIESSKPWLPEGINWCILAKKKSYWQPCCFFTTIMEAKMRKHYTCTWQVRETKHSSPSHTFRDVATFQDSIVVFCCHVATEFSLSRFAFLEHLWVWYSSTASQSMHLHWMMLHGTQADAACIFLNLSAWWPCVAAGYLLIGSNWLVITANAGNQRPTSVRQYVFCPHGFQQITKKKIR